MGRMPKIKMETSLVMGQRYTDRTTGYEGELVAIAFYDSGCIKGTLECLDKDGKPEAYSFDETKLVPVKEAKEKAGGPSKASPRAQAKRS